MKREKLDMNSLYDIFPELREVAEEEKNCRYIFLALDYDADGSLWLNYDFGRSKYEVYEIPILQFEKVFVAYRKSGAIIEVFCNERKYKMKG